MGLRGSRFLAAVLLLFPQLSHANDSTAELAAGGIVLKQHAALEMRSEDLFISENEVRVSYRFFNPAASDTKVLVAFPMPDIEADGVDFMVAVPTENPENLLDFHTKVDGVEVTARVEQKAIKNGVDQTQRLRELGLPVQPHLSPTSEALDRLPKATQAELLKSQLAVENDFDAGKGWEHHLAPTWTLQTTYFWEQIFPAGRELSVEHRYKPSVGQSAETSISLSSVKGSYARYCPDEQFMKAVRASTKGKGAGHFTEKRISYILKSGANWAAPIGDFRLVIDKGEPNNLISFCGDRVKKISPTQFEIRRKNFRPDRDLHVLILTPLVIANE